MKTAFLRLVGLAAADVKQIEVFLRFTGQGSEFRWISTAGDTCDLQLEAAPADGVPAAVALSERGQPAARGWILDRGQNAPDADSFVLRRPLQIDGFEALLRTRELQLARVAATAALPKPPVRPPAAVIPDTAAAAAPPLADDAHQTYRLLRWPGADLLRGKPKYVRMLGFLSNRPLSVERLKVLSGIDESSCRDLLGMLDQRGLLVRGKLEPDASSSLFADTVPSDLVASAAAPTPPVRETASAGLFSRLRKRLGLTS